MHEGACRAGDRLVRLEGGDEPVIDVSQAVLPGLVVLLHEPVNFQCLQDALHRRRAEFQMSPQLPDAPGGAVRLKGQENLEGFLD